MILEMCLIDILDRLRKLVFDSPLFVGLHIDLILTQLLPFHTVTTLYKNEGRYYWTR
jgi:hypothetical protein